MRQTDGRAITDPENVHSFSHRAIHDGAQTMNPESLDSALDAWSAMARTVTDAGEQFQTSVKGAVEQHWEGASADAAVRRIREFVARIAEFGEALEQQKGPLTAVAAAASRFKAAVPAPVVGGGAEARNELEQQARDDMSTYYVQPYSAAAPTLPTLPPPVDIVAAPPITVPGTDSRSSPNTTGGGGERTTDGPNTTGKHDRTGDHDKAADSDKAGDHDGEGKSTGEQSGSDGKLQQGENSDGTPEHQGKPEAKPTSQNSVAPQSIWSERTAPAGHSATVPLAATTLSTPPTQTAPASFAAAPHSVFTPASHAGPHAAEGSGAPTSAVPRPGPAVPLSAAPAAGNAQSTGPARVGTSAPAGYSGLAPHGAGRRGAGDGEHKSPEYLRSEEYIEELLGESAKTVPPVLGQ
ncbi:WXG100 family type VII secretion target [Nocardia panacis]|nr:PPE domain-containing protein [Nocardia panacis]